MISIVLCGCRVSRGQYILHLHPGIQKALRDDPNMRDVHKNDPEKRCVTKRPHSRSAMDPESSTTTSWFIPVLIGFFAIYVVKRLIPRSIVDIKEKFVLITGCDSGFGREMAIRLDKMGVHVLATCLTKEGEQSLRSVTSDKLKTFQMDVTNSQQIKDVYEEVKRQIPGDSGICKYIQI